MVLSLVPVKYEQVVFCGLSDFQLSLYRLFISSTHLDSYIRSVRKLMTRSCSSATIPRHLTCSKRCAATRSRQLKTRLHIANSSNRYGFFRLDGSMTITKRQKLVDQFNDPNG